MKWSVLLFCLLAAAAAAHAQVHVEPVMLVPAGPAEASATAERVSAASNGQEFLVTYRDTRGGRAARIASSGELLDPFGIVLPFQPDRVVWAGSYYFALHVTRWSTSYVRITPSGTVVDAEARRIKTADSGAEPLVGTDGKRVVLVYPADGGFGVTFLDGDRAPSSRLTALAGWQPAAIASNGDGFLLLVIRDQRLATFRLSSRGTPLDAEPHVIPEADARGSILAASEGNDYLIVCGTRAFMVNELGRLIGQPADVRRGPFGRDSVAWNGEEYVLAAATDSAPFGVWLTRISRSGARVMEPSFRETGNGIDHVAVAAAGGKTLVAMSGWPGSLQPMPLMAIVFAAGFPAETAAFPVTFSPARQSAISAALGSEGWLVVWSESTGVYASRLRVDGRLVDGNRMRLATEAASRTSVAWCGNAFVVAWSDENGLFSRAVSFREGSIGAPMLVTNEAASFAAAGSPAGAALVWGLSNAVRASIYDAYGQRLDSGPIELRSTTNERPSQVTASFDGSRFVAAWVEGVPNPAYPCRYGTCAPETNMRVVATPIRANPASPVQLTAPYFPFPWDGVALRGLVWRGSSGLLVLEQGFRGAHVFVDADLRPGALVPSAADGLIFVAEDGANFLVLEMFGSTTQLTAMDANGVRSQPVEAPRLLGLASGSDRRALAFGAVFGTEGADTGVPRAATALIVDEFTPR